MTNENQPVYGRRGKEKQSQRQIEIEDALKHFLACEEAGNALSSDSLSGVLQIRREDAALVLGEMRERTLAEPKGDVWCLTEKGKQLALEMVRRHRLYETFLAREKGVPADQWHSKADAEEHRMDDHATNALANRLGNPRFDPHGDPIPTREGDLPMASRVSLVEWDVSEPAMIDHIEDEPVSMYRKLVSLGLHAGMVLREMKSIDGGGLQISVEGRTIEVSSELLGMIHVVELPEEEEMPDGIRRLSELKVGEEGVVYGLSASCYGPERRRLLDLGIVPGTLIRCEFQSPFSSPHAYFVRGTLFGFRDEQAEKILLEPKK